MRKLFAAFGLAVLLASPATAGADEYANIHSVGVISGIGDAVRFRGTSYDPIPKAIGWDLAIADWKIDESVTQAITHAVAPRFIVKPIVFDRAWIYRGRYAPMEPLERRLQAYVRNMPASNGVDAYIIVQKDFGALSHQRQRIALPQVAIMGLQVESGAEVLAFTSKNPIYIDYTIFVVEAGTGKILDHAFAEATGGLLDESEPIIYRDNMWANSEAEFTATQKDSLKSVIVPAVLSTLSGVLDRLGLAGKATDTSNKKT